jgi:hypothetical protein
MENTFKLKIIAPLLPLFDGEEHLVHGLDELLELEKPLNLNIKYIGNVPLSIYYIQGYVTVKDKYQRRVEAIAFEVTISNCYRNVPSGKYIKDNVERELSDLENQDIFKVLVTEDFERKIYYFCVLNQIANPGSICIREGDIFLNGEFMKSSLPVSSFQREVYAEIGKIKWPRYKIVPFISVWNWFNSNEFSFDRHSKRKVEIALNAFTHLFTDNHNDFILSLLWSLVGIEALYTNDKEGISNQIFNKTQALLGPITDFKSKLKQMYNFRSRLVHGDLDIPPIHYDVYDEVNESFQGKLHESTCLAIAILTATFQEMVLLDKNELKFILNLE